MHFKRISEILALEWNIQKYFCKAELKSVSEELQTITSRRRARQTRVQPPPLGFGSVCAQGVPNGGVVF